MICHASCPLIEAKRVQGMAVASQFRPLLMQNARTVLPVRAFDCEKSAHRCALTRCGRVLS